MDVLSTQKKALLLGNEAVVRGAVEAGIDVATTYPGTPSSEIADTFSKIAQYYKNKGLEPGFYFQYSTNEKVALEFAAAAAVSGLRALTCMKHVGLNVASDTFMTYMYVGCKAGHVIITADDPSCHSSQNEQDNRYYAKFGNAPLLEPSDPLEAKDMVMEAFKISEELSLPILFRMTTRTSHIRGPVSLGRINLKKKKGKFEKNPLMVTVPEVARKLHPILLEKMEMAEKISENSRFNYVEDFGGNAGIVSSGPSHNYVREAVEELGVKCKILKLGMTNPLPRKMCIDFLKACGRVLVVEELEPFLEEQLKAIAHEEEIDVKIYGKGYGGLSRIYEYDVDIVERVIRKFFGLKEKESASSSIPIPPRPPVLCPGCPHRATYYAVKQVAPEGTIYPTDIGCYTLGKAPPLEVADFLLCMGSNVGTACGFSYATNQKVISFMGDSTFFHAGLPGIVNAVHHNHDCIITVLDNRTTAMTGHQPNPGTEYDGMGNEAVMLKVEDVVRGLGVKHVEVVNPNNLEKTKETFRRALEYKGTSVVVSKAPCILLIPQERRAGSFEIDQNKCTKCEVCIKKFGCPAFYYDGDKIKIDETLCSACGVCTQVCEPHAIRRKK
ncbi:MAG: indolepyruvate ferredoxin oxidoreductase subunit alpha [Candidatus Thermoplasmatota archaeon]|nr:indolepyruvate ferredoxin oxidoreductase subunit alpha [Candidatus Thermoplasmatota archaeon]